MMSVLSLKTSLVIFDVNFWKLKKLKNMNLILFSKPKELSKHEFNFVQS
eukprot:UN21602